jgi:hypothetical protein
MCGGKTKERRDAFGGGRRRESAHLLACSHALLYNGLREANAGGTAASRPSDIVAANIDCHLSAFMALLFGAISQL